MPSDHTICNLVAEFVRLSRRRVPTQAFIRCLRETDHEAEMADAMLPASVDGG
jgi:hypothetical protein